MAGGEFRTGRARSATEMRFAMSLITCRVCGTRVDPDALELEGHGESWAWTGHCTHCHAPLAFTFRSDGDPVAASVPIGELGDARPSQILRPGQLVAEIDRLVVRSHVAGLTPVEWKQTRDANERALTCLAELAKFFAPPGQPARAMLDPAGLSPEDRADQAARPERYTRAWVEDRRQHHLAIRARVIAQLPLIEAAQTKAAAPTVLDREVLRAHAAWIKRGRTGTGRLVGAGVRRPRERLGAVELTGAQLSGVDFTAADLAHARLDDTELFDAVFTGADLTSSALSGSRIRGGTFAHAKMALAHLERAVIEETVFTGADLDRSRWYDARVTGSRLDKARLGNAALDRAWFVRCNLRFVDFAPATRQPAPTTAGARFEDCDLRDSRWRGRPLAGAIFIRCKMAGIVGVPASLDGVVIEAPDLSREGDGSVPGTAADVLALWGA